MVYVSRCDGGGFGACPRYLDGSRERLPRAEWMEYLEYLFSFDLLLVSLISRNTI